MAIEERLQHWLAERRLVSGLSTRQISWESCRFWHFVNGQLSHSTGGFFSVTGVSAQSNVFGLDGAVQPIIDQPEIGILGFVVRKNAAGNEWLLQAKAEPGNIGDVQVAPTVQATQSNYTCLHGGAATPYLDLFIGPNARSIASVATLQSEQGNRFLGKYNMNSTVVIDEEELHPVSPNWLWATSPELRSILCDDFSVNTDVRSVLFSSDWGLLADGEPFFRWAGEGGWREGLLQSFSLDDETSDQDFFDWLALLRKKTTLTRVVIPLDLMEGWEMTPDGIFLLSDGLPRVLPFSVKACCREVECWDQPLMLTPEEETVIQICQCRDGIMKFLVRASVEIGFKETVQIGPTWQSDDVTGGNGIADTVAELFQSAEERYSTLQSDEGGRFFRSVCRYRILEIPEVAALDIENKGYRWMTLSQIYRLTDTPGVFTNEIRSALSMLLADV